jgi:O-succinylbenzoic acid--CoA ligase
MGRFDNIINTGGIKIFPEIVEKQIEQFIVNKFCITSLPSDILGQKLVLVIEQSGIKNLQLDMLLKQMIKTLPRYSYPKEIYLIQELFRNRNGKVVRKQITDYIIYNNIQPIKTF